MRSLSLLLLLMTAAPLGADSRVFLDLDLESVGKDHTQRTGELLKGKRSLVFCFASW